MRYYFYHPESECLFTDNDKKVLEDGYVIELTEEEYKQKQQELGMIDFGGTNQKDGDNFTESGAKPVPPEGWGTFVVTESKQYNGNLIYTVTGKRGEEASIFLGFGGRESWQVEQAKATLGKMMQICNVQGSGTGGSFQEADIIKFHGRSFDGKVRHRESVKGGKTFLNADIKNFAPAGSQAGTGTAQQNPAPTQPKSQGAAAFGVGAGGYSVDDVPF